MKAPAFCLFAATHFACSTTTQDAVDATDSFDVLALDATGDADVDAPIPTGCEQAHSATSLAPVRGSVTNYRRVGTRLAAAPDQTLVTSSFTDVPVAFAGGVLNPFGDEGLDDAVITFENASTGAQWARRPAEGGHSPVDPDGLAIAIDATGSTVVVGQFLGTANFGAGNVAADNYEAYIAKYDSQGQLLWSRIFPHGQGSTSVFRSVSVGPDDSIVVTGGFRGAVDFGDGPLESSGASFDIVVVKFSAAGTVEWAHRYGDDKPQVGNAVAVNDDGLIALTGYVAGTVDFGGGIVGFTAGASTFPVAMFDGDGNHLWSRVIGADEIAHRTGFATVFDPCGRLYVGGVGDGSMDFGDAMTTGNAEPVVAVYEKNGELVWSRRFPANDTEEGQNGYAAIQTIAVLENNLVAVGGRVDAAALAIGGGTIATPGEGISRGFVGLVDGSGRDLYATSQILGTSSIFIDVSDITFDAFEGRMVMAATTDFSASGGEGSGDSQLVYWFDIVE